MSTINEQLVNEVRDFVIDLMTRKLSSDLVYHNLDHTRKVVKNALLIGSQEGLSQEQLTIVEIAAWFHDIGYINRYMGHEEESKQIAATFLNSKNISPADVDTVIQAIEATKYPQQPKNAIDAVLCDADLMHLADPRYFDISELLRKEWKKTKVRPSKKADFEGFSIHLFEAHDFHTNYCKKHCLEGKKKNYETLKHIVSSRKEEKPASSGKKHDNSAKKSENYSRGVDSMFKMTARNQINLSSIADNKSNILLSLNGIIISLSIAFLFRKFEETPEIIIPTLVFLLFSLVTIVLAILSTRPNVAIGKFTKEDIREEKVNLLFFGNFFKMELKDYEWAVREMINNDEYLYSTMIKDQFFLGKVLARKYKLLRIAYSVFMAGMIISTVLFAIAFLHF